MEMAVRITRATVPCNRLLFCGISSVLRSLNKNFHIRLKSTDTKLNQSVNYGKYDVKKVRNIGIMAHIDAGKTTTTERMLYYSGYSKHIGDVDDGDTVMDYMEQERNRGITITSAAITFYWRQHRINLIDTPVLLDWVIKGRDGHVAIHCLRTEEQGDTGPRFKYTHDYCWDKAAFVQCLNMFDHELRHVDFTIEVERALRVLDGAVTILDASAGVEAQTLTVWRQAEKYSLPRLIFLNKMDKPSASFQKSLDSIRNKLNVLALPVQIPIGAGKSYRGHVDLLTLEAVTWSSESQQTNGMKFVRKPVEGELRQEADRWRIQLIDKLSDFDENLAEAVLRDDGYDKISAADLTSALKQVTSSVHAVPVFCGASLRNTGVQPLMNAVVDYLPSPETKRTEAAQYYGDSLSALVFKIIHDKQRGALTFLRLYSGQIQSGATLYNVNRGITEKTARLLRAYADEFKDIQTAETGDIVLVTGLKESMTGDTLCQSHCAMEKARSNLLVDLHLEASQSGQKESNDENAESSALPLLGSLEVPDPVFLCTIEPPSLAQQKDLEHALQCLQREDPSFHVHVDSDSGQTVLSGMGELHLEIIHDRIRSEYGVEAYLGPLQISYREAILADTEHTGTLNRTMGDKHQQVSMKLAIKMKEVGQPKGLTVVCTKENGLDRIKRPHLKAIESGALSALKHGPLLGFPVLDVEVELHEFSYKYGTSLAFISACASETVQAALGKVAASLMEPVMDLRISTEEDYLHVTLADLSRRRATIQEINATDQVRTIHCQVPLSELLGYSTVLRTITSGRATFSMHVDCYLAMTVDEQRKAVQRVTGVAV